MTLSQRELDLITKIGECASEYSKILHADGLSYYTPGPNYRGQEDPSRIAREGDLNEFASAVHIMQRMVMARAAQRDHPDFFPRRPAPVVDSTA